MTGNKNTWRAPLAGLASLAMIATMGVAAGTANAYDSGSITTPVPNDTLVLNAGADDATIKGAASVEVKDRDDKTADGAVSNIYSYVPVRANYTFTGWYTTSAAGEAATPTYETGTTLYAHWSINPGNTVTFVGAAADSKYKYTVQSPITKVNGGDYIVNLKKGDALAAWQVPSDTPGDGFKVDGWATSTSSSSADFDRTNPTAKAYKFGTADTQYSVTFHGASFDSYSNTPGGKVDVDKNGTVAQPTGAYTSGNKIVTAWKLANGQQYDFSTPVTGNLDLYAMTTGLQDGKLINMHQVSGAAWINPGFAGQTLGTNDAKLVIRANQSIKADGRLADPVKYGYNFVGWYLTQAYDIHQYDNAWLNNAANKVNLDNAASTPSDIYAGYTPKNAVTKTITYDLYYDGAPEPTKVTYKLGDRISEPTAPTRDGYTFKGWYVGGAGTAKTNLFGTYVHNDTPVTLYAHWQAVSKKAIYDNALVYPKVERTNQYKSGDYKDFTEASWKEYVDAVNAVDKAIVNNVQDNSSAGIWGENGANLTDAQYGEYGQKLLDAQKKLVPSDTAPVYRVYDQTKANKSDNKHLYTTGRAERAGLLAAGWRDEGISFYGISENAEAVKNDRAIQVGFYKPVFRLYDKAAGRHFYTAVASERDRLTANGWRDEGIAWYYKDGTTPVYRAYSPSRYEHLFTTSEKEYKNVTSLPKTAEGWYRAENVAFTVNE